MDWNLIKEGLLIMLKGMTGIFVVMLVIYLFIHLLSWITNRKANEEKIESESRLPENGQPFPLIFFLLILGI